MHPKCISARHRVNILRNVSREFWFASPEMNLTHIHWPEIRFGALYETNVVSARSPVVNLEIYKFTRPTAGARSPNCAGTPSPRYIPRFVKARKSYSRATRIFDDVVNLVASRPRCGTCLLSFCALYHAMKRKKTNKQINAKRIGKFWSIFFYSISIFLLVRSLKNE